MARDHNIMQGQRVSRSLATQPSATRQSHGQRHRGMAKKIETESCRACQARAFGMTACPIPPARRDTRDGEATLPSEDESQSRIH